MLAVADLIKAQRPKHRWQAEAIKAKPTWRRTKAGWLVQGNREILVHAMENFAGWVEVEDREGYVNHVQIEHVTAGDSHGLAFGWPVGTRGQA